MAGKGDAPLYKELSRNPEKFNFDLKSKLKELKLKKSIKSLLAIFTFLIFTSGGVRAQMFWNQACQFQGTSGSYIAVPNSSSININGSFSIEAWINPATTSGTMGILAKGGAFGSSLEYGIRYSLGRIRLFTNGGAKLVSRISNTIPANQWTHVAGTYNSTNNLFVIYINGLFDTTATVAGSAPPSNTDSLFIGISGATTPFSGQLDQIRLWNRELSGVDVSQNMRTNLGAHTGIYTGLVMSLAFQSLNSTVGFTQLDISGIGNSGQGRNIIPVAQKDRPLSTIVPNESVELDGNDDYLSAADSPTLSPTSAITIEAWVYLRSLDLGVFVTKSDSYTLNFVNGHVDFGINNNFFNTGAFLSTNKWTHLALTYDGTSGDAIFYLNGVQIFSSDLNLGNITNGTDSLYIGGGLGGIHDINGFIDEVRISHYAKPPSAISNFLYQSIDAGNQPDTGFQQIVYAFDGLASSSADLSPVCKFVNNARFSHPGRIANQPVSPLNRNDNTNFSEGYYMRTVNKRIPASGTSGTVSDSATFNFNSPCTDVNLFVALDHTNSSDVEIVLVGPNNDSVKVFDNKVTKSTDGNVVTIFDDQADSSLITQRYASFSPIIKAENNINTVFSGDNPQGRWKLIVRDQAGIDTGFLYAWGIQFNNLTQRPKDLDLSALIQGFYNPSTNLMVPDTIRIYLRSFFPPYTISDSSKSVVNSSGLCLFSFFNANNDQQYFLQLKHRNSIETWSNTFSFDNNEAIYNFFNAAGSAFGNNQIQVDTSPNRFAIYGGDVNQDDAISTLR